MNAASSTVLAIARGFTVRDPSRPLQATLTRPLSACYHLPGSSLLRRGARMQDRLDTVIAFVVLLLGLSVFVTVAVQFVVALLGLRGWNLSWGVLTLLRQAAPDLPDVLRVKLARVATTHALTATFPALAEWLARAAPSMPWFRSAAVTKAELLHALRAATTQALPTISQEERTILRTSLL